MGVVARSLKLQAGLEKLTGARGMTAREALELMAQALALPAQDPELAVMTIAHQDGAFDETRLAVLRSPTYASLVRAHGAQGDHGGEKIDLKRLIETEKIETVRRQGQRRDRLPSGARPSCA